MATHKFQTLDGMRGVAAVVVMYGHFADGAHRTNFYLAVDLFFALSGFVLAHSYDRALEAGMTPLRFMMLRLIRLYPLYLAGLAISAFAFAASARAPLAQTLWHVMPWAAAMLPYPVTGNNYLYPLNYPAWSIAIELIASAIFAIFWRLRITVIAIVVCVLAIELISVLLILQRTLGAHGADYGAYWSHLTVAVLRAEFGFWAGVLVRRMDLRLPRLPSWLLIVLLPIILLAPPGSLREVYDIACILVVFPALVAFGAATEPGRYLSPVYLYAGAISYAIYIIHVPTAWAIGTFWPVPYAITMVLIVGAAALLHDFYDVPVRRLLARSRQGRLASSSRRAPSGTA